MDPAFLVRAVTIPGERHRVYAAAEWHDAIVLVERGILELEYHSGIRQRFGTGDILWLAGLSLRALHNPGPERAVLIAVSRGGG